MTQWNLSKRTVASAAAALVAAGALSSCSSFNDATSPSDQADASMASNATPNGVSSGAGQANGSQSTEQGPAEGVCRSADLEFSTSDKQGGAGSTFFNVVLTNKGSKPCTLDGFPGVSLVTDNNGTQLGASARREENVEHAPVNLDPGAAAIAPVRLSSVDKLDQEKCQPAAADGLRVYPPEETKAGYIPMEGIKGCGGDEPVLSVQPVTLAK